MKDNKPVIEAIINSVALAITSYGVVKITSGSWEGYIAVLFGVGIEWFKYYGRSKKLW